MDTLNHIAVAGNIGAGKTTLVRKLADHYQWQPRFEAVDDNPYLEDFYQDMAKWAFPLQIFFLNSRFNHIFKIQQEPHTVIQDRTIYEDAHIFAKNLYQSGDLSQRDYATYFDIFSSMVRMIHPPDLLIYLRADIPKLVHQISKRGRAYEEQMSLGYLEDLNDHYEAWIDQYDRGPLLILDVNDLDYVARPEDMGHVIQRIDSKLNGLFSYQRGRTV